MDKKAFIERMRSIKPMERSEINKILMDSIDANVSDGNPRGHHNFIIVMEELAELSKEIAKQLRGKGNYYALLEELADVQLGLYYIQQIADIGDEEISSAIAVKMERVAMVLYNTGTYR